MYAYASGAPRTLGGFVGFGAQAPASARAPIRAAEAAAALKLPGGQYTATAALLNTAISYYNSAMAAADDRHAEAWVTTGEQKYMVAYATAQLAGTPLPLPKNLTVTATGSAAAAATTSTITALTDAIKGALQSPATPTTGAAAPATPPVGWFATPQGQRAEGVDERSPLIHFLRPIGPLRVWQWLALGGVASVALGVASRVTRVAVIGGAVAAGALGIAGVVGGRRA